MIRKVIWTFGSYTANGYGLRQLFRGSIQGPHFGENSALVAPFEHHISPHKQHIPADRWDLSRGEFARDSMQSILLNFRTFQSLGILGSLPAAALILSLFCLLLYLMSRCCDRKPRPAHSITSLKVTLSIVTVLCCAAIGLGEFKVPIKDFSLCSSMTQRKVFL